MIYTLKRFIIVILLGCCMGMLVSFSNPVRTLTPASFLYPPIEFYPGVYWYFMDGNLSKEGITKDLESMKKAGIRYAIVLEVNLGLPRGKVDFMSEEWLNTIKYLVHESERVGVQLIFGTGPGWNGSGGPWVKGEQSMQHLVASTVTVKGKGKQNIFLPVPPPRNPYFGTGNFTDEMKKHWEEYYKDVCVLAFPTPPHKQLLDYSDEKALYYRAPYSSKPHVKQSIPTWNSYYGNNDKKAIITKNQIIDLTSLLQPDGSLQWDVPDGSWTIMRFGSRNNGAVTRPAPLLGIGMESDKFDTIAIKEHFKHYIDRIFQKVGISSKDTFGGIKMLHIDSWEMGAQNWTAHFREEFMRRRGYDPQPFYPVYTGLIVQSREISERFLWDVRQTSQELIIENHAGYVKRYSHRHGLSLSIEPYDMNPSSDLELGAVADYPMCEFWSNGYGFDTSYSVLEATSDAHLIGQPVVPSESFTAARDMWRQYPSSMKDQTDWAFAAGINRLMFHTFQHQCLNDSLRPGMTMGVYGVHWDRNQTWWDMAIGYHQYVARCQYMLQQGRTVADILYLTPEGAPHVFRAPSSATESIIPSMPDRKGYNFDACPPSLLYRATVKNGRIIFPSGASYRVLMLPDCKTMTPKLLNKIYQLISQGATVVTKSLPEKSPSLMNYPQCDKAVISLSKKMQTMRQIIYYKEPSDSLYQPYTQTASLLSSLHVSPDFLSDSHQIRYTHRTLKGCDIYFISNRTNQAVTTNCSFRISHTTPELWNPMTGKITTLNCYKAIGSQTQIPLKFEGKEAYFIVFRQGTQTTLKKESNFSHMIPVDTLNGAWKVSFEPQWGGPRSMTFSKLTDWSKNTNDSIKYYSGSANYDKVFYFSGKKSDKNYLLNLSKVEAMAHVWLNGQDRGIVWTNPYQLDITASLKNGENKLHIEVVNLWPNRLIGDLQYPNDPAHKKYTYTTYNRFKKDDPLLESGLIGPVEIMECDK
jgi:hypothetical protein